MRGCHSIQERIQVSIEYFFIHVKEDYSMGLTNRADHMGCYGHGKKIAPFSDELVSMGCSHNQYEGVELAPSLSGIQELSSWFSALNNLFF